MITMKKKLITIIVGMLLCAELLGGCGNKDMNKNTTNKDNTTTADTAEESKPQDPDKNQELPAATYMVYL